MTASRTFRGLLTYVERLKGAAKLRPDSRLVITRAWADPDARLNGALQLSPRASREFSHDKEAALQATARIARYERSQRGARVQDVICGI